MHFGVFILPSFSAYIILRRCLHLFPAEFGMLWCGCLPKGSSWEQILERKTTVEHTVETEMKANVHKCHCDCSLYSFFNSDPFHHICKAERKVIWRMCEQAFIGGFFSPMAFVLSICTCNSFSLATKNSIQMFGSHTRFSLFFSFPFSVIIYSFCRVCMCVCFFLYLANVLLPLLAENIII